MAFTHQGHWDPQEPLSSIRGLPFPILPDSRAVQDIRQQLIAEGKQRALHELGAAIDQARSGDVVRTELEPAVVWQKQLSRPLIINEFGVLKAQAPPESRLRWLASVVDFAERHCWGWTHWELAQGFGILDDNTPSPTPRSCGRCWVGVNIDDVMLRPLQRHDFSVARLNDGRSAAASPRRAGDRSWTRWRSLPRIAQRALPAPPGGRRRSC